MSEPYAQYGVTVQLTECRLCGCGVEIVEIYQAGVGTRATPAICDDCFRELSHESSHEKTKPSELPL